jgi:hypothetical protein
LTLSLIDIAFFLPSIIGLVIIGLLSQYLVPSDKDQTGFSAFVQDSNNSSTNVVMSNSTKPEVTLKGQVDNSSFFLDSPFFVAIISALSALGGAFLGSFMTNRSNRQMEDKRYTREKEEADEVATKVRALVSHNLNYSSLIFDELQDKGKFTKETIEQAKTFLNVMQKEYRDLSIELRLTSFKPKALTLVQSYYELFDTFSGSLFSAFSLYENEVDKNASSAAANLEDTISNMPITHMKELSKTVIDLL